MALLKSDHKALIDDSEELLQSLNFSHVPPELRALGADFIRTLFFTHDALMRARVMVVRRLMEYNRIDQASAGIGPPLGACSLS